MLVPKLAVLEDKQMVEAMKAAGKTLYECDPAKNMSCKKNGCYALGGDCKLTTKIEFALMEETDTPPGSKK